jgi:hypothetical protein
MLLPEMESWDRADTRTSHGRAKPRDHDLQPLLDDLRGRDGRLRAHDAARDVARFMGWCYRSA